MRHAAMMRLYKLEAASTEWWDGMSLAERRAYITAHPGSKFSNHTWELPPRPGTAPIPEGHVRLYHQTSPENLGAIKHQGIQLSKARGIEGPRAIWADDKGFYGKPEDTPTIEFHVHNKEYDRPFVLRDQVPPEQIVGVHHRWHKTARYIEEDPDLVKEVVNGVHDHLLKHDDKWDGTDSATAKAIRYIKHRYAPLKETASDFQDEEHPRAKDGKFSTRGDLQANTLATIKKLRGEGKGREEIEAHPEYQKHKQHSNRVNAFWTNARNKFLANNAKAANALNVERDFGNGRGETTADAVDRLLESGHRIAMTSKGARLVNDKMQGYGEKELSPQGWKYAVFMNGLLNKE